MRISRYFALHFSRLLHQEFGDLVLYLTLVVPLTVLMGKHSHFASSACRGMALRGLADVQPTVQPQDWVLGLGLRVEGLGFRAFVIPPSGLWLRV